MSVQIVSCDCGAVEVQLLGSPRVRAICHCGSCRALLGTPFFALIAWSVESFLVSRGERELSEFKYPGREMRRYWCQSCGTTVYNTTRFDFRLVSQELLRKANGGQLPERFASDKHLFYAHRAVDVADYLPKYLEGIDSASFED